MKRAIGLGALVALAVILGARDPWVLGFYVVLLFVGFSVARDAFAKSDNYWRTGVKAGATVGAMALYAGFTLGNPSCEYRDDGECIYYAADGFEAGVEERLSAVLRMAVFLGLPVALGGWSGTGVGPFRPASDREEPVGLHGHRRADDVI